MSHPSLLLARAARQITLGLALGGAALALALPAVRADNVVSAGADKKVKVWSLTDGSVIKTIDAADGAVTAAAFSPDGKTLATGSADKKIKLWSFPAGLPVRTLDGHDDTVTCLVFAPDGKKLISGGADKKVKIWDLDTAKATTINAHDGPVIGVVAVEQFIISGGADNHIKVWGPDGSSVFDIPTEHTGGLKAMVGSPTKQMVYSAGADGKIKYFSQAEQGAFDGEQGSAITALAITKDGKRIISGGANGDVKVWDTDTHKAVTTAKGAHDGAVNAITITPDGQTFFTGGADKKGKAWKIDGSPVHSVDAHDGAVTVLLYHADAAPAATK